MIFARWLLNAPNKPEIVDTLISRMLRFMFVLTLKFLIEKKEALD
jgi:hypothetical protein